MGRENVCICQMGRRATDGDFATFQKKVTALPVAFEKLSVGWTTLRGQQMMLGWEGALKIDGAEQPVSDFPHFDNPCCQAPWPAEKLEIRHGGQTLTLELVSRG